MLDIIRLERCAPDRLGNDDAAKLSRSDGFQASTEIAYGGACPRKNDDVLQVCTFPNFHRLIFALKWRGKRQITSNMMYETSYLIIIKA
ncbi:hypothetical protein [Sphingobium sp. AntQ-1]|uniref:hypothetical protein n=1 Tax=Sphingobium sp. AntQ-1 TaxID=2930091 RepID=UPI00234ED7B4|nr:hypothetical protein [Sphingobium sp. AntQ-1]